ncbi:MAG: hypothetical protein Q8O68_01440 [Candidatus Daviesbacteria bacterium]|nr:hypothetical protein [Candidatus Daviesbacteria bacterium]
MVTWLTDELRQDIRKQYEPLYKRKLTDDEIEKIAVNLTEVIEAYLKMKWKQKYANAK